MLSSRNFGLLGSATPLNGLWRHRAPAHSVLGVPPTDEQRDLFRQRLGLALTETREQLTSYTQESIGKELSVDRDTVGRWERGKGEPKSFDLHWMAGRYKVDGDLFLNPPDSITELHLRIAKLRKAAQEAGAAAADHETGQVQS